jgi:hypothetical protein
MLRQKLLSDAGFEVSTTKVDVSSRASVQALVENATSLGEVSGVIHAAGVSPSQASPETILKVDLYGTALVLEEFGNVIARGGAGVVIASQSGHRLPPLSAEQNALLATTPVEELLAPDASARSGEGLASRLSDFKARKLVAGDGGSRPLGEARRADQYHQPWHHHHPAGE